LRSQPERFQIEMKRFLYLICSRWVTHVFTLSVKLFGNRLRHLYAGKTTTSHPIHATTQKGSLPLQAQEDLQLS